MATHDEQLGEHTEISPLIKDEDSKEEQSSVLPTVKLVIMSSAGIFADGWDLQVMNLALAIISQLHPDSMTVEARSFSASMTFVGVIVGQLSFGVVADMTGRKLASLVTATLTVIGVLASSCVSESWPLGLATSFGLCRFFAGLGIGGEYPLSASLTKEAMKTTLSLDRTQLLVLNMAMMNFGTITQALLVWTMVSRGLDLNICWRVAVGVGALPSMLVILLRLKMEEPKLLSTESRGASNYMGNISRAIGPAWMLLLGACLSWALFNFSAYGQSTFASTICDAILGKKGENPRHSFERDAKFSLMLGLFNIGGTFIGSYLVTRLSLRWIQALGFALFGLVMFVGAWSMSRDDQGGFATALLILFSFAINGILGITTYLVPTESFSAVARATAVGVAAASGKFGAMLGTALFPFMQDGMGLSFILTTGGVLSVVGVLVTLSLLPKGGEPVPA
eukprot:TRINITY_DN36060_c0_g1_i1.p1 TRINITY_DN36060_c0_g1~~TRINITY_DN36060_c0_g1_i1.p1  ORF type:complete len:452 (+),score=84.99 TRINITY_DN36060_c0_g1_i1:89-1444(+)